jgi:hypothetical protein
MYTAAALLIVVTPVRPTRSRTTPAMLKLATSSGCMACHSILPVPRRADGMPPNRARMAATFRLKYRDDPSALRFGSRARS